MIDVRTCDAKPPHEVQDKMIFLGKLRGSEDDVNAKLRREMQRWLAAPAGAVITRTDPYRPALSETALVLEAATLGKNGAAQTQLLERFPRLPGVMMMLCYACLTAALCLTLPWVVPRGSFFPIFGDGWDGGAIPNITLATAVLLLFAMEVMGRVSRRVEKHQHTRQLRAPPFFGRAPVRHHAKVRTVALLLGSVIGLGLGWASGALGFHTTGWQVAVPVATGCALLGVLVQGTLQITVDSAVSRASLLVKSWMAAAVSGRGGRSREDISKGAHRTPINGGR